MTKSRPAASASPPIPSGFLPITEAAKRLHCSGKTIRRLIDYGKLRGFRVGYQIVVAEKSITEWLRPRPIRPRARRPSEFRGLVSRVAS